MHTWLLEVGLEHVQAVGGHGVDRVHGRFREGRRAEAVGLAEEQRPGFTRAHEAITRGGVARRGRRAAGVGTGVHREAVKPLLVVGQRVAGAQGRLLGAAEDRAEDAVLHVRTPGETDVVADVRVVDVVGLGARRERVVLRLRLAGHVAGLEQIAGAAVGTGADARDAAQVLEVDRRVRRGHRGERQLDVPAHTTVEGQRRGHTPGVGRVEGVRKLTGLLLGVAEVHVFAGRRVKTRRAGDGRHAAREHRVQRTRIGQVARRRPGEVRRVEQADGRIKVGVEPEAHDRRRVVAVAAVVHARERSAEREAV